MTPRGGRLLSAADASNVIIDSADQVNVFLMAGLLGQGGFVSADGRLDIARLRAVVSARLTDDGSDLARFSERVRDRGGDLVWEQDEPDLDWHVRVDEPVVGEAGLAGLCASLMTTPLPKDRPLWEVRVVPGAWSDGPGIVVRVHHAVTDGVGGVALMGRLLGGGQEPLPLPSPPTGAAIPRRRVREFLTGVLRVVSMLRTGVPRTVLLGPISDHRGAAFVDVELDGLSRAARAAGATVNDALLAAVAGAVEAALRAEGHHVPTSLPVSVPVALPDRGTSGNAVGVMRVELPARERDPRVRMAQIGALTRTAKAEARAQGTFELTRTRWGSRAFAWFARRQRFIALFVTNVRGPKEALLVDGAPLEKVWPLTPIQGNVRLGISALSYRGRLGCAIHADADHLRADVLADALKEQLDLIARQAL